MDVLIGILAALLAGAGIMVGARAVVKRWIAAETRAAQSAAANREISRRAEADARIESEKSKRVDIVFERDRLSREGDDLEGLFNEATEQRRVLERERKK